MSDGAEEARTGRVNGSKRSPRTHQTAHLARASHAPRHVLQEFKHCATTHAPLALIAQCTQSRPVKVSGHARLANAPRDHCASPPESLTSRLPHLTYAASGNPSTVIFCLPLCRAVSLRLSAASITRRIHCLTCSGLPPTGPVVNICLPSVTPHSGVVACSLNRLGSLVSVLSFSMSTQRIPSLRGHTCSALAHKTMLCLLTL